MTEEQFKEFPTELELSSIEDPQMRQRRLISRILAAANAIAAYGRKGSANYVFIHEKNRPEKHIEQGHLAGIEIMPTQSEDTITVGRQDDTDDMSIKIKLI
jgi:hypothetical protein